MKHSAASHPARSLLFSNRQLLMLVNRNIGLSSMRVHSYPYAMILKTAVSHRGTETTEAADKQRHLQKGLKNCYPRGEDKASETRPLSHWLCALRDSAAIPTAGFRMILHD